MHRVVRLVVSLAGLGSALVVASTPAGAGASAGEGPGATISVGTSAAGGSGGSSGEQRGGSPTGTAASTSPWSCVSTYLALNNDGGTPPGGPTPGSWYSVTCDNRATGAQWTQTEWISSQSGSGPVGTMSPVDPHAVALQAENSLVLPRPVIQSNPSGTTVVNLPTWFWIDPSLWHADAVTATVGSVSATAVATPVSVAWSTGNGGLTVCAGPGIPYDVLAPPAGQTTYCSYRFSRTSAGQPSPDENPNDGAFVIMATITWSVSWSATGATGGGQLPLVAHQPDRTAPRRPGGERRRGRLRAMSTRLDRTPIPNAVGNGAAVRNALPVAPRSRRPLVAVASAVLVCASVAGFVSIYSSAGQKTAVIVVIQPIGQGQSITAADLGQVEVSVPSGVDTITVADASELAGKRASVAISAGSLLVPGDLTSAPVLESGDAVVGIALKDGQYPVTGLTPGDAVTIVQTASPGAPLAAPTGGAMTATAQSGTASDGSAATGILVPDATIFATGAPSSAGAGDSLLVSVEIPATLAPAVATAATAGQVSLVLLPGEGSGSTSPSASGAS